MDACPSGLNRADRRSHSLQTRYVEPALTTFRHHAEQRPLFTTFALVFGLLSFFPVLLFTLFAAGTVLAVGGAALVGAAVVIAWLVGSAGAFPSNGSQIKPKK